ncbi:MAG TPA: hypothetical protein VMU93_10665 [Caulobacteraceae bacterium]|nr:hypothetical protein [Caulobacteraceae bacterium]
MGGDGPDAWNRRQTPARLVAPGLSPDLAVEPCDLFVERAPATDQSPGRDQDEFGKIGAGLDALGQGRRPGAALGPDQTQLVEHGPDGVRLLGALAHQKVPGPMQRPLTLLLHRLDRHEAHRRAPHRLAAALGVARIVLGALDVALHVDRRHQLDLMAQPDQRARPIVRRAARLHADQRRRPRCKKLQDLASPQLAAHHRLARGVHPVHLNDVLGQINSEPDSFHGGQPPLRWISTTSLAHLDALRGLSTHHPGRAKREPGPG